MPRTVSLQRARQTSIERFCPANCSSNEVFRPFDGRCWDSWADVSFMGGGNRPVLHALALAGHRRGGGADDRLDPVCVDAVRDQYRYRGPARPPPAVGTAPFRI